MDIGENNLRASGLINLAKNDFPNLETLKLSNTEITDEGLLCLEKFPYLEELDLSWNHIKSLKNFETIQLPKLKILNLGKSLS